MDPKLIELIEKSLPPIFTLLGTILGALGTIIITVINKKSEEKRQIRELTFKAGIENWKGACELAKHQGGVISPLDWYLLHMKLLSEEILENKIKPQELKGKIRELKAIAENFVEDKNSGDIPVTPAGGGQAN